jgi:uncharacterized protein
MGSPEFVGLHGDARTLFQLQGLGRLLLFWFPVAAVTGAAVAFAWSLPGGLALGLLVAVTQGIRALGWPFLSVAHWGYRLEPEVLLVQRGVLFRTLVAIPRSRIQHVDVRQGPLERLVGLVRIQVHTASGLGADGSIPGLAPDQAERLRNALVAESTSGDGV